MPFTGTNFRALGFRPYYSQKISHIQESFIYKLIQDNRGTPIPSLSTPSRTIRCGISSISGNTQGMDALFKNFHFENLNGDSKLKWTRIAPVCILQHRIPSTLSPKYPSSVHHRTNILDFLRKTVHSSASSWKLVHPTKGPGATSQIRYNSTHVLA